MDPVTISKLGKVASGIGSAAPIIGLIGGIGSAISGFKQGRQLKKEAAGINPVYNKYETSQAAREMLGLAQTRLNAINPMRAAAQRNVGTSQANTMAGISRNVTDPSQALAMAAGIQGQADQAFFNIGAQDQAMQQQNLANLMQAQNVMIGEDRMKYNDMMNKFMIDQNRKDMLRQASMNSTASAWGGLSKLGFAAGGMKQASPTQRSNIDLIG